MLHSIIESLGFHASHKITERTHARQHNFLCRQQLSAGHPFVLHLHQRSQALSVPNARLPVPASISMISFIYFLSINPEGME
ncbi:MAG: hypothetical protein MZU84_06975 [Sphingobacterium sp.]|nr:hypothetical protein [Sphingobacterium sp.]